MIRDMYTNVRSALAIRLRFWVDREAGASGLALGSYRYLSEKKARIDANQRPVGY